MRIQLFVFMLCCLSLAACAKKADVRPASPADFVAVTPGEAAEQAHSELAMLAKLRGQGLQPLLPSPDPSLDKSISISWTGPASGALKDICLQLGYRYRESVRKADRCSLVGEMREAMEFFIFWIIRLPA